MSRVANQPVAVPTGVEVNISGQKVTAKGPKGNSEMEVNGLVSVAMEDGSLKVASNDKEKKSVAMAGTMRALLNNCLLYTSPSPRD